MFLQKKRKKDKMYSIHANVMYALDDEGKHSIEINYVDSDGADLAAYAEGNTIEAVVDNLVDQLEEEVQEQQYAKEKAKQINEIDTQIAELEAQLEDLKNNRKKLDLPQEKTQEDFDTVYKKFCKDFESWWK